MAGGPPPPGTACGLPSSSSPALKFEVLAQCGRARASRMTLPHFVCETPMFMPVGTQGAPPPPPLPPNLDAGPVLLLLRCPRPCAPHLPCLQARSRD